ncbi:MAG TPA: hypothetical protein VFE14_15585 [Micromonosporaceae bacterium]|nr:hypothetical protein [Micromonosporaceae bacterium]
MSITVDTPRLGAMVAALAEGEAAPLRQLLAGLGVDVEAVRGLPRWNAPAGGVAIPHQRGSTPDGRLSTDAVLDAALTAATPAPAGAALLGLYLRYECEEAWEISYHFDPIWQSLRGMERLWPAHRQRAPGDADRAVAEAVLCALRLLDQEISVENEQTCGAMVRHAAAARSAVRAAELAIDAAERIRPAHPEIGEYLTGQSRARHRYYAALAPAIDAAAQALRGTADSLPTGIEALLDAEADEELLEDNDRSELRAHRFSLQELATAVDRDWLTVDHAKIVYIYPFGLRGVDAHDAVDRVRAGAADWRLAGVPPDEVRDTLDLDDVWAGSDFLGRRFEGAALVLPELTMSDVDGGQLGTLAGELRFSKLGNHYLRLEAHVHEMDPHDLQFALFRAAPEHGTIRVTVADGPSWPRLSSLAVDLVHALPAWLAADGEQVAVSVRPGMYHVLLTVHDATLGAGPAAPRELRRPARTADELVAAVGGAVLLHPVLNAVGAIAEWSRYPQCAAEVIHGVGRRGDLVARTENTSLIVMLGTPSFLIGMHETIAEFVASLDGLFGAWFDELAAYHTQVMQMLDRLGGGTAGLGRLTADAQLLQQAQLRLHDFVAEARSVQGLIRSPALVASPLDASTLRRLLDAAGYARVEEDFAAKVAELLDDRLGTQLEALAARRQQEVDRVTAEQERRSRARMDTLLAVIAAAGVSGVVQVLQAGLNWGPREAEVAAGSIVGLAIAIGFMVWISVHRRRG